MLTMKYEQNTTLFSMLLEREEKCTARLEVHIKINLKKRSKRLSLAKKSFDAKLIFNINKLNLTLFKLFSSLLLVLCSTTFGKISFEGVRNAFSILEQNSYFDNIILGTYMILVEGYCDNTSRFN